MAVSLKDMVENPRSFSGADVPDNDLLRDCVHCGMCLPSCPTYRLTGDEASSPRGRLWLMKSVAEGRLDLLDAEFDEQMYQCLNCRACEAVCPSGVQYGPLVEASRSQLEQHRPRPLWQRVARKVGLEFPFGDVKRMRAGISLLRLYQRSGIATLARKAGVLKLLRLQDLESMLPVLREKPLISGREEWSSTTPTGQAHLFNGCIMSTAFSNVNRATGRVMAHNGIAMDVPEGQQCCGALAVHAGMMGEARRLARKNIDAFEQLGDDTIIVTAAGCGAALKEYDHLLHGDDAYAERAKRFSTRVQDVTEFLGSRELVEPQYPVAQTVTYQEPCHLAHAQRIIEQPRRLLGNIPGLTLVEMRESSLCCGSAGVYNIIRKSMADELGDRKVGHIVATNAEQVITGNPGCAMQLQTSLRRNGAERPVRHVIEVLDEAYGGSESTAWAVDTRAASSPDAAD